jgi:putative aldouronate transport system substrate-binding protein
MEERKTKHTKSATKLFAAILTVLMMITTLAGCANERETIEPTPTPTPTVQENGGGDLDERDMEGNMYLTGLPIVKEKETLVVAVNRHPNDATDSYDEKYFVKKAEEETNVHIEWQEYATNLEEQMSVLLAGDNLPDVFLGLLTDSHITQNPSLFVTLNDKMEKYTPHVLAYYEEKVDDWKSFLTYPDGNIYSLMGRHYKDFNNIIEGHQYINKKWLDNLGLDIPKTMEEFKNVLIAFRDNDVNGNGDPNDEIPMDFSQSHYASKIMNYATAWGIPYYYAIKDGKVLETVNTDAYREFLEYFHELGKEGILNVEGFSQTDEQYTSHLDSMRVGAFYGWAPYTYINDFDKQQEYVVLPPVAAEGYEPVIHVNLRTLANRSNFVITAQCENPEIALRWWDYLSSSEEISMGVKAGEEGLIYRLGEDGIYYSNTPTADDLKKYGYDKYVTSIGTSTLAASLGTVGNFPLVYEAPAPDIINEPTNSSSIRRIAMNAYEPFFEKEIMSQAVVPAEKQEEFAFQTEGLIDYINSFTANSIINGVTDSSWNEFNKQLDVYNYPYYIQWHQDYYDGEFSK